MFIKAKILDWRLLLGCSLGIIFLYVSLPSDKEVSDFDELALGTENIVMLEKLMIWQYTAMTLMI